MYAISSITLHLQLNDLIFDCNCTVVLLIMHQLGIIFNISFKLKSALRLNAVEMCRER